MTLADPICRGVFSIDTQETLFYTPREKKGLLSGNQDACLKIPQGFKN